MSLLLEQLDRPRGGQAGAEARVAAERIREALELGPAAVSGAIAQFGADAYAQALLAALDDVERALEEPFPDVLKELRTLLRQAP